jgi:hypothetical protein
VDVGIPGKKAELQFVAARWGGFQSCTYRERNIYCALPGTHEDETQMEGIMPPGRALRRDCLAEDAPELAVENAKREQ